MEKNKVPFYIHFKEPIYIFKYTYLGSFFLLGFIVCLILGIVYKNYSIIYGWIINIPAFIISNILDVVFNQFIMELGKSHIKKSTNTFISIILFMVKYIIVFLGLIIALIVNEVTSKKIFNYISLLTGILVVYIIGEIIGYIHYHLYAIKHEKDNEEKSKE